jgi:hypothetical protein
MPFALVAVFGIGCASEPIPGGPTSQQLAEAVLHNGSERELVIGIANPAGPVDCALLGASRDIVPAMLSTIAWTPSRPARLEPFTLLDPKGFSSDGWTGIDSDCQAYQLLLPLADGTEDERLLFAHADFGHAVQDFSGPVALSELGPRVVSVVVDSPMVWRATSDDLLYERGAPLDTCPAPPSQSCTTCLHDAVPGGFAFGSSGPPGAVRGTVAANEPVVDPDGLDRTCHALRVDVEESDLPWVQTTSTLCGPAPLPSFPFLPGEAVSLSMLETDSGARLFVEGEHTRLTATTTLDLPPSDLDLAPARGADPICVEALGDCPSIEIDRHQVSIRRSTGGVDIVGPVYAQQALEATLPQPNGSTSVVQIWMDATRTMPQDGSACASPPLDLLYIRTDFP